MLLERHGDCWMTRSSFMEHRGYEFRFMCASEGPDPAVWMWTDTTAERDAPTRIAASLLDMLERDPKTGLSRRRR